MKNLSTRNKNVLKGQWKKDNFEKIKKRTFSEIYREDNATIKERRSLKSKSAEITIMERRIIK